jgi:hypothetical protein
VGLVGRWGIKAGSDYERRTKSSDYVPARKNQNDTWTRDGRIAENARIRHRRRNKGSNDRDYNLKDIGKDITSTGDQYLGSYKAAAEDEGDTEIDNWTLETGDTDKDGTHATNDDGLPDIVLAAKSNLVKKLEAPNQENSSNTHQRLEEHQATDLDRRFLYANHVVHDLSDTWSTNAAHRAGKKRTSQCKVEMLLSFAKSSAPPCLMNLISDVCVSRSWKDKIMTLRRYITEKYTIKWAPTPLA